MIALEFTLIIIAFFLSLSLVFFSVKNLFYNNDYFPILTRWSKAFTYTFFYILLTFMYMIIRTYFFQNVFCYKMGEPIWIFHLVTSTSIGAFKLFAAVEFFKSVVLIKNSIKNGNNVFTQKQDYFNDILLKFLYSFLFLFIFKDYYDFFNTSVLVESGVSGFKGIDIYFGLIVFILYCIQFILLPKKKINKIYISFKCCVFTLFAFSSLIKLINIIFFNYTFIELVFLEWLLIIISLTILSFYFGKKNRDLKKSL